ncbi:MAG: RNA methyltransferase [Planctomycetota bacterium JB042]
MRRVVLVRTQGPRNAGLAARACANFGPCELWFVRPAHGDLLGHPDFRDMAHGVEDRAPPVVDTLEEALADCTHAVGFTARGREHRAIARWPDAVEALAARAADPDERVALVFGNERVGLTDDEARGLAALVWIPTSDVHTSLNLAAAVTVVLAGVFDDKDRARPRSRKGRPATGEDRAFLIRRMEEVLGERTGSAPAARDLRASIERVFSRAPLETRDVRAWHRLLRHLGGPRRPEEYGLPGPPPRDERRPPDED